MCNKDCFNCTKKDCICDDLTEQERKQQDECDKEIKVSNKDGKELARWKYYQSEKGKAMQRRYAVSEKGKATKNRYNHSEKCKEAQKRYRQSEKGKASAKRNQQKKIASGKNAEYCRRYKERKKAEKALAESEAQPCKA